MSKKVIIKTKEQINAIREAGKYLTELLEIVRESSKPGVILMELEETASRFLKMYGLTGAFKGYHGYPANLCLSVNDCLVHGIPDATILQPGDLLKIDAGVVYEGCIADSAVSVVVGGNSINPQAHHLATTTKKALDKGLQSIGPGTALLDYATIVYETVKAGGCSIIRNLTGHGVGTSVHEGPSIYNRPYSGIKDQYFQAGMVVALEPITAITSTDFKEGKNEWNLYTSGGDLGAQWEYTVTISEGGCEVLAGIQ